MLMSRLLIILIMAFASVEAQAEFCYRLCLKDKEGSSVCAFSRRSLERRARQGIQVNEGDYGVSPVYQDQLLKAGLQIVTRSRWMNSVVVKRRDGAPIDTTLWSSFPFVESVHLLTSYQSSFMPGKRELTTQEEAYLDENENFRAPIYEVKGEALYEAGYRGKGMLVAVLDGGFENANSLACLNRRLVGSHDLYMPTDATGYIFSCDEHGSQCLSIMACDTARGVWGTAPEAEYFVIRTENANYENALEEDMWIAGCEYADSIGADVISSSLGYFWFDDGLMDHDRRQLASGKVYVSQGAEAAAARGMLVCSAAGNERTTSWGTLNYPSDAPNVLTVGSTNSYCAPSTFTSPGFLVPYVKPDVACRGTYAYYIDPKTGKPVTGNGTSYSTPMMCGLCTSLWSAAPSLTVGELLEVVRSSSSQYERPNIFIGYGMPDFSVALESAKQYEAIKQGGSGIEQLEVDAEGQSGQEAGIASEGWYDQWGRRVEGRPVRGLYFRNGKKVFIR